MNPLIQTKNPTILPVLILVTLGCFGLSPQARAVCQEGCLGIENTVLGEDALLNNAGFDNTAVGYNALTNNTTGFYNTATGSLALLFNTTGHDNTATGSFALYVNTTGVNNTATGAGALTNNNGNDNIAVGFNAGVHLTTGNHNIYIGNAGGGGSESGKIRIGKVGMQNRTFIAGISGANVPDGVGVIVGSDGRLGTILSSARYKDAIEPMDKSSEVILSLKPVTFRYKHDLDVAGIPQFGLVAEEVEKVNPALVARDGDGKAYTVRYEAVNVMLLNEFLKEHRTVQELKSNAASQEATITQLKSTVAKQEATAAQQQKEIQALTASLKEQASQIQKVSAQLELGKSAPQTALNNQ